MKKRIILSVTNDLSSDQRVSRISTTLHENGYDVLVVGRKRRVSVALKPKPYQEHRLRLFVEKGPLFYLAFNVRLFLFLLTRKADIYWANDMDTLLATALAAKIQKKRLFYDSHEYWTEIPELIHRPKVRKIWYWLEKRLFPKVDKAMTVNQSIANIYSEKYGKPVHSIRNLPFLKPPFAKRREPGRILIYQGALNIGRGLELMIGAMPFLPGYYLQVLGSGPLEEELRDLVSLEGMQDRVQFYGLVPFEELHAITRKAALGLSIEEDMGKSYHFALPNKLFDYIQGGIPALVSDLPEMRRIIENYRVGEVLLPNERSGEKLATRIRSIVESKRWLDYHRAALIGRKQLCWENECGKLMEIIEES